MFTFVLALTAILASSAQSSAVVGKSNINDFFSGWCSKNTYDFDNYFDYFGKYQWNGLYSTDASCQYPYEVCSYKGGKFSRNLYDVNNKQFSYDYVFTPETYNSGYYLKGNNKIYCNIYYPTKYTAAVCFYDKPQSKQVTTLYVRQDKCGYNYNNLVSSCKDIFGFFGFSFPYSYNQALYPSVDSYGVSKGAYPSYGYGNINDFFSGWCNRKYDFSDNYFDYFGKHQWYSFYSTDANCQYPYEAYSYKGGKFCTELYDTHNVKSNFDYAFTPETYNSGYYLKGNNKIYCNIYYLCENIAVIYFKYQKPVCRLVVRDAACDKYTIDLAKSFSSLFSFVGYGFPYSYNYGLYPTVGSYGYGKGTYASPSYVGGYGKGGYATPSCGTCGGPVVGVY